MLLINSILNYYNPKVNYIKQGLIKSVVIKKLSFQ